MKEINKGRMEKREGKKDKLKCIPPILLFLIPIYFYFHPFECELYLFLDVASVKSLRNSSTNEILFYFSIISNVSNSGKQ